MASKTSKKTVTTSSTSTTSHQSSTAQQASVASQGQRTPSVTRKSATPSGSKSPLSPTRYSRIHEKEELANLNDRLACYIDRMRHLESENSRLSREVRTTQETVSREVTNVQTMYENELSETKLLLDEMAKEKAKLEMDSRRLFEEADEFKKQLDKKTRECNNYQASSNMYENRASELQLKVNQLLQDKNKLADEVKSLEKDKAKLIAQLAENRKLLEEETLVRIDLENTAQTLREELNFKKQLYEQQMVECRTRKQVEISELDGKLSQEYEERLYQGLQEIREQYEADLENNREEVMKLYEEKIRSLTNQLSHSNKSTARANETLKQMQARFSDLNQRLADLEAEKNAANARARDFENELELTRGNYIEEFAKLDAEITRLREEMARQVQDYQDLMDTKITLDLEIAAYRKLIEGEEERLNITPVTSPSGRQTPRKVTRNKRKRTYVEESEDSSATTDFTITSSAKSDIEIKDICQEGKFVRLFNKGSKEISLSGWQLIRKAGDNTTTFKFHRSVKIDPGATVTVWSADIPDVTHEPPESIVMKGQKWVIADQMITTLLNQSGDEFARVDHKKIYLSTSFSRQRETGGGSGYFQRRAGTSGARPLVGDERCSIM